MRSSFPCYLGVCESLILQDASPGMGLVAQKMPQSDSGPAGIQVARQTAF